MAWTLPRTWVDGELVNAALLNAQIRDNLNYLLAPNVAYLKTAAGVLTTTSTVLATLGTAWSQSLTLNGGHLQFGAQLVTSAAGAGAGNVVFAVTVDGTPYTAFYQAIGQTPQTITFHQLLTGLASGAHTLALQWRANAGTITATIDPTIIPLIFWAKEA